MKAKISYTVSFEEIPNEVNNMLDSASKKCQELHKHNLYFDQGNIPWSISQIDSLRKKLVEIDTRLADCYDIINGYREALTNQNNLISSEGFTQTEKDLSSVEDVYGKFNEVIEKIKEETSKKGE